LLKSRFPHRNRAPCMGLFILQEGKARKGFIANLPINKP
jgi:hypothetical protein